MIPLGRLSSKKWHGLQMVPSQGKRTREKSKDYGTSIYTCDGKNNFKLLIVSTFFHKGKPLKGKWELLASVGLLRTIMSLSWPWRTGLNSTKHLLKEWVLFPKVFQLNTKYWVPTSWESLRRICHLNALVPWAVSNPRPDLRVDKNAEDSNRELIHFERIILIQPWRYSLLTGVLKTS